MSTDPNFSSIWISLLAVAGGLTLLVAGGELLVSGAVRLAKRLGMSSLLIGLTVVAFGTSMPEMFVSLAATFQGHADIMIGNVVGSNIANIGLILAVSALLYPLHIKFDEILTELYLLLAVSFLVLGFAWIGTFYRLLGLIFVAGLIFYTTVAYREAIKSNRDNGAIQGNADDHPYLVIISMMVGGLLFLAIGSDFFIDGAVDVARAFGVSELVIGLTLAAVGTSLPELASCISAIRRLETGLLVGNVVGSNLFNLMMVMGGTAAIAPFALPQDILVRDLPVMIVFSGILVPIFYFKHVLSRVQGFLLLIAYGAYLFILA